MVLIQLTGLSGSGKTTLGYLVKKQLIAYGFKTEVIDGDEFRRHLCRDLSFSKNDRIENIRRLGFVSELLARNGIIAILAAINPFEHIRRELTKYGNHVKVIWLDCPVDVLIKRDTKGLYKKALLPDNHPEKISNLTGINDNYENPFNADLILKTDTMEINDCVVKMVEFILTEIKKNGSPLC